VKGLADRSGRTLSNYFKVIIGNLATTRRSGKQAVSICVDLIIVAAALWVAYTLRLGELFSDFESTAHLFVLLPLLTVTVFAGLGIYRWVVRSTNRRLFRQLVKGCIVSCVALALLVLLLPPDRHNPRSLFVIYGMLVTLGTAGARFVWQELFETNEKGEPVAIYGAGSAGQELLPLLAANESFRPVIFLDDDMTLQGTMAGGVPIHHSGSPDLEHIFRRHEVSKIILAMPRIGYAEYQRKLEQLDRFDLPVQTIPSINELVTGRAAINEVRDISVEDILGRAEVPPDLELLGRCVHGKTVLVTGGGGSIGSELCRQILSLEPTRLIVLDNTEAHLYRITEELRSLCAELGLDEAAFLPVLCSVTDRDSVQRLFEEHAIDTVYHAAAYKHVPIVEMYPAQGTEVNLFGTLNVLDCAVRAGASRFVLVSTDKAVRPTNSMGATKRVAELVLQAKSRTGVDTIMCMVRFGNVLGSSGSVVPKFQKQIQENGPVTLTHPDITRYFMTIPEAAQLVLQAGSIATGGDVFVLDMGEPVRIMDLAETMVKLNGKELASETGRPDDIEIVVEGLRPGEKMYEELFLGSEHKSTRISKVFVANEDWLRWDDLEFVLERLATMAESGEVEPLREELLRLAFLSGRPVQTEAVQGPVHRVGVAS